MTAALRKKIVSKPKGLPHRHHVPAYHFNLKKSCYCASGLLFGECCGNDSPDRKIPSCIHVVKSFLLKSVCDDLIEFAAEQNKSRLDVIDHSRTKEEQEKERKQDISSVLEVDLGVMQKNANAWATRACDKYISQIAKIEWFEVPRLLQYEIGGNFTVHSDSDRYDEYENKFYRFVDRDFSSVLYLNDDYEGGGLNFPWLNNFHFKPSAGDLLIFPSNNLFSHESLPLLSGRKFSMVSFGAFYGTARVRAPKKIIRL